ncbi:MAG TPA: pantoate--beta-alanine ligase [Gemmatimonadota bacterium]|nr:pantoate--beta-alanine ligase [Gemmatimonadota bacterium]
MRTIAGCRAALAPIRAAGRSIGFVPTMGALHEGHLSLVDRARELTDHVAISIFVNPTQFESETDLSGYPRDEARDLSLAEDRGADLAFVPALEEMYRTPLSTRVTMRGIVDGLEGAARPGHFDGVLTVVTKLLNVVQPDVAVFGQKDAQQAAAVRRLVADLDFPVRLEVAPTVREPDGLAASSRNARLSPVERVRALAIPRAVAAAEAAFAAGERRAAAIEAAMREALESATGIEAEYAAVVSLDGFEPVERVDRPSVAAVAARVGAVRLIDNAVLDPA